MNNRNSVSSATPISGLVGQLRNQARSFVHEEYQLAKAELAEKGSRFGRNGAAIAVAGMIAYACVILMLQAFGLVIAYAFAQLGWSPLLSIAAGFGCLAGFLVLVSVAVAWAGMRGIQGGTLKPEKTIESLKGLNGSRHKGESPDPPENVPKRSTDEMESDVLAVEDDMGRTLREIRYRITPDYLLRQADEKLQAHPYRWSLIALGTGLVSGVVLRRRLS